MSKNSIYTFDYFQPKEYRFSLDSVFLAQKVALHLQKIKNIDEYKFLDLCSGSGVIGLELSIHLQSIQYFDFLEVQEIYSDYFLKNLAGIHKGLKNFKFLNLNYNELIKIEYKSKYNIVVCNPPYFFQGEGLFSPNEFKNRCRFFMDSDFNTLIMAIINCLKPSGEAFVLVRPGDHHGRNLLTEINLLLDDSGNICEIFDNVRGTNIIRIIKKSSEI